MNESGTANDFAALYRRHVVMVRRAALRILRDPSEAEDIAQETFLKFAKHTERSGDARDTAALLYRIATNLALTRLRTAKRRQQILDQEGDASIDAPGAGEGEHHSQGSNDARIDLERVLQVVSEEEARVALHYYVEGMEQEEIANLLGMQRRTVGRRLEHFRERAQKVFSKRLKGGGRS